MKKLFAFIFCILLIATSCKAKPANDEIALPDTEIPKAEVEKETENEVGNTTPEKEIEPGTSYWKEEQTDTEQTSTEDPDAIEIDGVVINNDGYISKEMTHRDIRYELGPELFSPSTLEGLMEGSDMIVVATPKTDYDDAKQIWKTVDGADTDDFSKANLVESFTKRTFTVKEVIKGEPTDEIDIFERAISKDNVLRIVEFEQLTDKDTEYLLFLYKANASDAYFMWHETGKYITHDSTFGENNPDNELFNQIHEQYKEYFKD